MIALRSTSTAARGLLARSTTILTPAALAGARLAAPVRFYADGEGSKPTSPGTTGSWSKREQSEEAAFARAQDKEKLKKLRESLAKQKAHLEEVEKALNEVDGEKK